MEEQFLQPDQLVEYKDGFIMYRQITLNFISNESDYYKRGLLEQVLSQIQVPITIIDVALDNLNNPFLQITQSKMNHLMHFISHEAQLALDNLAAYNFYVFPQPSQE